MSLLCFISGFIVIYSIANHQASLKKWDIGLLKTLGADFKSIRNQFLWQFASISLIASLTGITISFVVSYLISKFILNTSWDYSLIIPLISLGLCLCLSLSVTFLATYKALKTKTIELLY
jgi:putative ABC transport system permease protein